MKKNTKPGRFQFIFAPLVLLCLNACTIQSSLSNRYLTAEKLWSEKNYAAAASEFDRVMKENPNSALGLQALWRASMTRTLFLNQHEQALRGFEMFLERAANSELAPQAQIEIGDIYFSKLGQYGKAIDHYQSLLNSQKFRPEEQALFSYRIARSYFLSNRIKKSIEAYETFLEKFPHSNYEARGKLDLAQAWYAMGETDRQAYNKALKLFGEVAGEHKNEPAIYSEAIFGVASIKEEVDQLENAYDLYQSVLNTYPAPNVIRVKLARLQERMKKKRK